MTHPLLSRRTLLPVLLAIALAAPACGSSDSRDGAARPKTTTTGGTAEPAGFDAAAYCDASLAIEQAQPDIDFETATPEEMTAGLKAFAAEDLEPLFDDVAAAAPDRDMLVWKQTRRTYAEVERRTSNLAAFLHRHVEVLTVM